MYKMDWGNVWNGGSGAAHGSTGTGYAGNDTNDKKRRTEGLRLARTKEAHRVKERYDILRRQIENPTQTPTDELKIILRQTLRNFGVVNHRRALPYENQLLPLTLKILKDIIKHHPKELGNLYGNDDSIVMALEDSTRTAQLKIDYKKGISSKEQKLAQEILNLLPIVKNASLQADESPDILVTDSKDNYRHALRPFAFAFCDNIAYHHFMTPSSSLIQSPSLTSAQQKRLFQELSSLQTSLPIEFGSSILVRAMEDKMNHLRVLIFGPDDTPYANGCFLFDLILDDYPHRPPKCHFLTTGGGKYRLNPNLYQCGKVCLSLLGTWSGPSWQPNESTLLQLLISIQSLILGEPEPYFNEPGREAYRTTTWQQNESIKYSRKIRDYTCEVGIYPFLSTILSPQQRQEDPCTGSEEAVGQRKLQQQLKQQHPYPEFQEAIDLHFRLKKELLIRQLREWGKARILLHDTTNTIPQVTTVNFMDRCLQRLILMDNAWSMGSEIDLGDAVEVDYSHSFAQAIKTTTSTNMDNTAKMPFLGDTKAQKVIDCDDYDTNNEEEFFKLHFGCTETILPPSSKVGIHLTPGEKGIDYDDYDTNNEEEFFKLHFGSMETIPPTSSNVDIHLSSGEKVIDVDDYDNDGEDAFFKIHFGSMDTIPSSRNSNNVDIHLTSSGEMCQDQMLSRTDTQMLPHGVVTPVSENKRKSRNKMQEEPEGRFFGSEEQEGTQEVVILLDDDDDDDDDGDEAKDMKLPFASSSNETPPCAFDMIVPETPQSSTIIIERRKKKRQRVHRGPTVILEISDDDDDDDDNWDVVDHKG